MERHNGALKVLFFEILRDLDLNETVSPWFSRIEPKPLFESTQAQAFWDVPVYAEHTKVRANRVDARIIDHKEKKVLLVEVSCPWIDNREKKEAEIKRWKSTDPYASNLSSVTQIIGSYNLTSSWTYWVVGRRNLKCR